MSRPSVLFLLTGDVREGMVWRKSEEEVAVSRQMVLPGPNFVVVLIWNSSRYVPDPNK